MSAFAMWSLGLAAVGLLALFTDNIFLAALMLTTAFVVDRLSPENRMRITDKQLREIEDFANKRDEE